MTLLLRKLLGCLSYAAPGECPERQRELTVNQPPHGFVGSSPTSPTSLRSLGAHTAWQATSDLGAKRAKAAAP